MAQAATQLVLSGAREPEAAPVAIPCSGAGTGAQGRLEPLSPTRVRVEFTARVELYDKLEKARESLLLLPVAS